MVSASCSSPALKAEPLETSVPRTTSPSTTPPPPEPDLSALNQSLTAPDVETLLDQLPVEVSENSFAGWRFEGEGDEPLFAVLSFKGEPPDEIREIVAYSSFAESIQIEGGAEYSLADHQDFVGEGLSVLGAKEGEGWYDTERRVHVVKVAMDPERWDVPGVGLLEALNAEIVAAGGRRLLKREIEIEEFGPEFIRDEPRAPGEP